LRRVGVMADAVVTGKALCDGDDEEARGDEHPVFQLASDITSHC